MGIRRIPLDQNGFLNIEQSVKVAQDVPMHMLVVHLLFWILSLKKKTTVATTKGGKFEHVFTFQSLHYKILFTVKICMLRIIFLYNFFLVYGSGLDHRVHLSRARHSTPKYSILYCVCTNCITSNFICSLQRPNKQIYHTLKT